MTDQNRNARLQESFDMLVIGAGPTGLACAIEAKKAGLKAVNVEKGCLVNSLFNYPANMTFFTTPELLEIGDIPFPSPHQKPNRHEALEYYRKVAEHYGLHVRQYQRAEQVTGADGDYRVRTTDLHGHAHEYHARKLVIATGYYDRPNLLDVPGEGLAKVFHYYREPHPYFDCDVLVVGGKNSAAIAALELWRHGARVTLVHRGPGLHPHVKYWIKPDVENRIAAGQIAAYFQSSVAAVSVDAVVLNTPSGEVKSANDFVFAMTGYHPDFTFLRNLGIEFRPRTQPEQSYEGSLEIADAKAADICPACDPQTLESNVPGIYLAGVIVAGSRTNEIFIENGRFHGRQIAEDVKSKLRN
ncbi:MAG: YpdA family putative bacillithiol disulfide reductase [Terriglobales bacterium]|jgi:thioredoxin reductase (NADPH)